VLKKDEIANPESCLNRAREDELVFVLLGRDVAAPVAIRAWASERIARRKNEPDDRQIMEAHVCANLMELQQRGPATAATRDYLDRDAVLCAIQNGIYAATGEVDLKLSAALLEQINAIRPMRVGFDPGAMGFDPGTIECGGLS